MLNYVCISIQFLTPKEHRPSSFQILSINTVCYEKNRPTNYETALYRKISSFLALQNVLCYVDWTCKGLMRISVL
jgi:hypothetical protein